jgi:hypothetical protein
MTKAARLALTLILALYGFVLLRHPEAGSLVDNIDLPIHETGHIVFRPFGDFMQFLGGTLFQLIMPSAFVVYFWRRRDRHAASVGLWWVAQNLWNISVYIRDARAQELPLVGGGEHDWAYLLGRLGHLKQDQTIGHSVWMLGVLIYLIAVAGGLWTLTASRASDDVSDETADSTVDTSGGGA